MSKPNFEDLWSRYGFNNITPDELLQIPKETWELFLKELGREDLILSEGKTYLDNSKIQQAIDESCQDD